MKTHITFFVFIILFISFSGLNAQPGKGVGPIIPLQQNRSVLFGKDIVINDQPGQDQRTVAICSAFNGWLYSAYSYSVEGYNHPFFTILRSTDNGITWSTLYDYSVQLENHKCDHLSLISTGDSISNIKIILSGLVKVVNGTSGIGQGFVSRFNGETGAFEQQLFSDLCYDVAISGDLPFPAGSSNPSSIGVLYSKYSTSGDSIIFKSSSDGGMTLNNRQVLAVTGKRFNKVSLTYGRSLLWNSGRYFAVWVEKNSWSSTTGHIFTAHSDPDFNSPFTKPVCLDSLDPSAINKARNPVIACQVNNADNDSSNLTEVVMFEKYLPVTNSYDLAGYYNLQATNSRYFRNFSVSQSTNNKQQPDIFFNPYNSTFMLTYFDSTNRKLPFLKHDFNMVNPDSWDIITPGYNDSTNISAPYPKVSINTMQQEGVNVWIADGSNGKGVAMFDAPYSTWTGISEINKTNEAVLKGAYPNPCHSEIKIAFEIKKTGKVTINLFTILEQPLGTITDQSYTEGRHLVQYDVSDLPEGTYLYNFKSGDFIDSGKFTVIR